MVLFKKVLFALLFMVIAPGVLFVWAERISPVVQLPVPDSNSVAMLFALPGLFLLLTGLTNVFLTDDSLPVNNHPKPGFITQRIYHFVPYPVYCGFSLGCIGISILLKSPAGLWLISPVVVLSSVALVYGYEKPEIHARYGAVSVPSAIGLAVADKRPPLMSERLSAYILVLIPWLTSYQAVSTIGIVPDAINNYLPIENSWPVIEWTTIFYFGAYIFVPLVPFVARQAVQLRQFSIAGMWGVALTTMIFIVVPFVAPPRPFVPETFLGSFLAWERTYDTAMCAFPSFHAMWALMTAWLYAKCFPRLTILWWGIGLLICLSCVTTGMHSIMDVMGGMFMVPLVLHIKPQYKTTYFILWHLLIIVILIRLWFVGTPLPLIVGLDLILIGIGNYLETSNPMKSTAVPLANRSLFRGTSVICILLGIVVTTVPTTSATLSERSSWIFFPMAFGFGLISIFSTGVVSQGRRVRA